MSRLVTEDKEALYFIAIVPADPVQAEVMRFKEEIYKQYGSKGALRSPAHITLHMPFKWKHKKFDSLITCLETFAKRQQVLTQELNGFSAFDHRVIYVDVEENAELRAMQKDLMTTVKKELNLFNADYKQRGFHPHMTIAFRDLKKATFLQAWPNYEHREYKAAFEVDSIALLKHNGKQWEVFKNFSMS